MEVVDVTLRIDPITLAYLYLVGPGAGLVVVAVAEHSPGRLSVRFSIDAPEVLRRLGSGDVASLREAQSWAVQAAWRCGVDLRPPGEISWSHQQVSKGEG